MQTAVREKPQYLRTEGLTRLSKRKGRLTCISLFTGIGGFDIGFHQAGWETRVMVEWDKHACETLRANFTRAGYAAAIEREIERARSKRFRGWRSYVADLEKKKDQDPPFLEGVSREPAILQADITKTTTEEILKAGGLEVGEADGLTGGFPCQGFSTANRNRSMEDQRNYLYRECVRVIREALPRTFVLENVRGLVQMEKGGVMRMICDDLADCGYDVAWKLLNCADYGVPQQRWRVIFVGERRDILLDNGPNGRPALFMGHGRGEIRHDDFFEKKYPSSTQAQMPI